MIAEGLRSFYLKNKKNLFKNLFLKFYLLQNLTNHIQAILKPSFLVRLLDAELSAFLSLLNETDFL